MTHGEAYYAHYGGMSISQYVERHIRGSAGEMARIRQTVGLVPSDVTTLLDVGAGHGVFLEELRGVRGIAGVGIEVTAGKVDYGRSRGLDMRLGDARRLGFADREFDAVVACEVLEHLPFGVYEDALCELARVARRWVLLTVPFDERRRFVRCPYCAARVNADYHFRSFTPAALGGLLPGFRLERWLGMGTQRSSLLLTLGRRLTAAWPPLLVCPSCGYHAAPMPEPAATAAGAAAASDDARGAHATPGRWLRRVVRALPAPERPVWLVGLFTRAGA